MKPTISQLFHQYFELTIAVLLACLFGTIGVASECDDLKIRRNFLSLSKSEWSEYIRVFRQMYSKGIFDQLAAIHADNFVTIHDYPQFLVWHRYFLWDFEKQMRTINPELTLPYWVSN